LKQKIEMRRRKIIFLTLISLLAFLSVVDWLNAKDYLQSNYKVLTTEQENLFKWKDEDDTNSFQERYRKYFFDKDYFFPGQKVTKIKLYKNIPLLGPWTGKTLNSAQIKSFIHFCNDPTNFDWDETTWQASDSEYYFKLFNNKNLVIGKIYFCLEKCGMTNSKPFCPAMKTGGLSEKGKKQIEKLIHDKTSRN